MNISHELMGMSEIINVISKDYKDNAIDPIRVKKVSQKEYVEKNKLTYYVAMNTWLNMIADCDQWAAMAVASHVREVGLIQTIRECMADADSLVRGEMASSDVGQLIVSVSWRVRGKYFALNPERNHLRDDLATSLQLLRYLKRFSPSGAYWVQDGSLSDFIQTENATKLKQRREHPVWLIEEMREIISDLLPWEAFHEEFESLDMDGYIIPPGATVEGFKTLRQKVEYIANTFPEAFVAPMGYPYIYPVYQPYYDDYTSVVQAVPKSYKAARIIAKERLYRQAVSEKVAHILSRYLPTFLDIHDQSRNQRYAQEGSRQGNLATLDASHASDLISKTLFREVFPDYIVSDLETLLSNHWSLNDSVRMMQMMSTSGHALTFILETIVYYAIAQAACNFQRRFGQDFVPVVSVYGDDVVISSQAAQTAKEFYSLLGLKINDDKSFVEGPYRESCGEEYYNGINLTSAYYPRFPIVGKVSEGKISLGVDMYRDSYRGKIDDSTTMLIDLQKKMYQISYNASLFLWDVIKAARPKLTTSTYGTICGDLWGAMELGVPFNLAERTQELVSKESGKDFKLPGSVVSACATQKHYYASVQYTHVDTNLVSVQAKRIFDLYKYQNFLKTGPTYATPLDELLGVSEPPMSFAQYAGIARLVWRSEY